MSRLQNFLLWFVMLSKRLYKKPTFLVLVALIPVLILSYVAISGGESGMITVGLACDETDPLAQEIFSELQGNSELLSFHICADSQEAKVLLQNGKLDAVWIFPGDMAEKIETFAQQPTSSNAFITVLERESNVALMLSREKLNGVVYPYIAQRVYVHFLRDLAPELDQLSDEQLLEYYQATNLSVDLFAFEGAAAQHKQTSYLLSPLRGLLGIVILICSLASQMHYIRDAEQGTFAWVSRRFQFLPELGCQMTASLHVSTVCLVCLLLCNLAGNIWIELAVLFLYSLCCSIFAMALRQLCSSIRLFGTMLPLVIVVCLVICPVFLDLGALRQLQYLLPPTYYINAIYDSRYLLYMAGYTTFVASVAILLQYTKYRIRRH